MTNNKTNKKLELKNDRLASTETVQIQGKVEKALATYLSFLDFLNSKSYIKEGTTDVLNVESLTGSRQSLGNGTGSSDVYKIEEQDSNYEVNYYDEEGTPEQIWSISGSTSTGDVTLEPDTGKESLILEYNLYLPTSIELPYSLSNAIFNFNVDWGDGTKTEGITNENIKTQAVHQYESSGTKIITITGQFENLSRRDEDYNINAGIDYLTKIQQWGTTGLKRISLEGIDVLQEIAQPTESSFKDLSYVDFGGSGIYAIPDNFFANCTNITSFGYSFESCENLETIGENIFFNCVNVRDFSSCFRDCVNLTTIPEGIFEGCTNVEDFTECFADCTSLTGKAPEIWLSVPNGEKNGYIGIPDGNFCFVGCTGLDNYEQIPPYWRDGGIPD